ncbi:hypothetical protein ACHQM5_005596 [Ranunculus cassubicifolius]
MKPISFCFVLFSFVRFNNPVPGMHCVFFLFLIKWFLALSSGSISSFHSSLRRFLELKFAHFGLPSLLLKIIYFVCFSCCCLLSCLFRVALLYKNSVGACFLRLYRLVQERVEVISLTSGRIFRLRSAPAASLPRTHKLTSSLDDSEAKLTFVCGSFSLLLDCSRYRQCLDAVILVLLALLSKDPVGDKKTLNQWTYLCISSGFRDVPEDKYIPSASTGSSQLKPRAMLQSEFLIIMEIFLLWSILLLVGQYEHPRAPWLLNALGWASLKLYFPLFSMFIMYSPSALYNFHYYY